MRLPRINVRDMGATGNGSTDDRQAFVDALGAADELFLPAGQYLLSKAVSLSSRAVRVTGPGTIAYRSDDQNLAATDRRAFQLDQCGAVFEGVTFVGDPWTLATQEPAVYATGCTDVVLDKCHSLEGGTLFQQDGQTDSGARIVHCTVRNFSATLRTGDDALIDGCIFEVDAGQSYDGGTHAIYVFASRNNIIVRGCTFKYVRGTGVKVSGTVEPVTDVRIEGNLFQNVGMGIEVGTDNPGDADHTGLAIERNHLRDCGTNGTGYNGENSIRVLGCRSVRVNDNHIQYTRASITTVSAVRGITVARYAANSPEVELCEVRGNVIQGELSIAPNLQCNHGIYVQDVQQALVEANRFHHSCGTGVRAIAVDDIDIHRNVARNIVTAVNSQDCGRLTMERNRCIRGQHTSSNQQFRHTNNTEEYVADNLGESAGY